MEEKPRLDLFKKSDIVKSNKITKDFEYTFLDFKQVSYRIKWLNDKVMENSVNLTAEEVLEYISEAFEELIEKD